MGVLGSNSARRATLRIARRDALRHKGRSALIAVMVAVPVFAAAAVSVLARAEDGSDSGYAALMLGSPGSNRTQATVDVGSATGPVEQSTDSNGFGSTDGTWKPFTTAQFEQKLSAVLPAGDAITRQRLAEQQLVGFGDRLLHADVVELDLRAGLGEAVTVEGRFPQAPGEAVVTRALARADGLQTGDRLIYQGRAVTVAGIASGLPLAGQKQLIGPSGSLLPAERGDLASDAASTSWFVTGPAPVRWPDVQRINAFGGTVLSRYVVAHPPVPEEPTDTGSSVDRSVVATGAVVVGLVLLQIALMAGPAIAVGTRRNERGLALLASAGGEPRHLRAVVLAGGALVGLVASTTAALAGAAAGGLAVVVLRERFDLRMAPVELHPWDLVILAAVGTLTAAAAALLPARRVGKLDVVAALTGRRPVAVPRLGVPVIGAALTAGGLGLAWWAAGGGRQFPTVAGLGMAEVGLVVASAAIVGLLARLAAHTPFASRFALRDAARQRGRTAPAVAAVLAAVAGGMTAVVFVSASNLASAAGYESSAPIGTPSVYLDQSRFGAPTAVSADRVAAARAALQQSLPVSSTAIVYSQDEKSPVSVLRQSVCTGDASTDCGEQGYSPWFAGPQIAPIIAPSDPDKVTAALAAGRAVVFQPKLIRAGGTISVSIDQESQGDRRALPATLVPGYPHVGTVLLPRELAGSLGVRLHPSLLLAGTSGTPTGAEVERARSALQRVGIDGENLDVEEGYRDQTGPVLLGALIAALLVALIGTFTAVGLAAAEARADVATLAAVGAAPGLRRRIGAAQAGAIAVPGAVLGVISGTAAGWALIRLNAEANASWQPSGAWHYVLPGPPVLALGLGIPLVAVLVGFASVRSRLTLVRRLGE